MSSRLFCFAGGGTGGHLYPALAVAEAIRWLDPQARLVFFGSRRPIDERVLQSVGGDTVRQELAPLSMRPWRWPRIYAQLRKARNLARDRFRAERPAFVLGTGGLASVPPVLAAHDARIPCAILNPDAVPGKANRYLAARTDAVFAQWEATREHLPRANVVVTGCPIRPEFRAADRAAGMDRFGLDPKRRTLLVTGASQGARTINDLMLALAGRIATAPSPEGGPGAGWQVLHLTGEADYERVRQAYREAGTPAVVISYTEHMADALTAADIVVSRAGASTLAELTAVGRASLLLPYPYDRGRHQWANARCLAEAGAAVVVEDAADTAKTGPAVWAELGPLMADAARRQSMARAAASIGRPDAAETVARLVVQRSCDNASTRANG